MFRLIDSFDVICCCKSAQLVLCVLTGHWATVTAGQVFWTRDRIQQ